MSFIYHYIQKYQVINTKLHTSVSIYLFYLINSKFVKFYSRIISNINRLIIQIIIMIHIETFTNQYNDLS